MKKLIIAIPLFFALLFCLDTRAQVSGHRGGLLIIKTDLMSPLFDWGAHGGLELVAFRRMSFTVDYNLQREFLAGNYLKAGEYFNEFGPDAMMRSHSVSFGIRFYGTKALPAPYGSYYGLKLGFARYQDKGTFEYRDNEYNFTYGPLGAGTFTFVYGYQWILLKRMTIDLGVSLQINRITSSSYLEVEEIYPDIQETLYLQDFNNEFGANLYNYNGDLLGFGLGVHFAIGLIVP